jgi:hypothetical protein
VFKEDSVKTTEVPLDPYYLGAWLGDGSSNGAEITTMDQEILSFLASLATKLPGSWCWEIISKSGKANTYRLRDLRFTQKDKPRKETLKYRKPFFDMVTNNPNISTKNIQKEIPLGRDTIQKWRKDIVKFGDEFLIMMFNPIKSSLDELGILNNKHIPEIYFQANRETKLKLLAGLIDTDGYLKSNSYEIVQKSTRLAQDIHRLATELGFFVYKRTKLATCTNGVTPESKTGIPVERMSIFGLNLNEIPCLLPRKQWNQSEKLINVLPKIQFVAELPMEPIHKRRKLNWTTKQDAALLASIELHGQKWATILRENKQLFGDYTPYNVRGRYKVLSKT